MTGTSGNPPPQPGSTQIHQVAITATAAGWRAHLYVTFLFWKQLRQEPTRPASPHVLPHPRDASPPALEQHALDSPRRQPEGPWDDTCHANRRLRSCAIILALLILAWLTTDLAAAAFARIDFDRLLSGG